MDEAEMIWLAEMGSVSHRVVEIGSWMGRSTRALADNCPGTVLVVDTWSGSGEHKEMLKRQNRNWLHAQFLANISGLTNLTAMRMSSTSAASQLLSQNVAPFDMVFIDGSHEYRDVKADILAWKQLLAPKGIICGHDYDWDGNQTWLGVKQAVDELLGGVSRAVGSIWYQVLA